MQRVNVWMKIDRVAPQKTEQSIFQDFALINSYLFSPAG